MKKPDRSQIGPGNEAVGIQGDVAARRKLIKIFILLIQRCQLLLRPSQLIVLELNLGLMDFQLVDQL